MRYARIIWDEEHNSEGNVRHISEHGLTTEDVEYVIQNSRKDAMSRSTGFPCSFGYTTGGDYIIVIYEMVDEDSVYPVTAYEVPEP